MKNQVILKSLTLINFKGIANKTISFDQITNIFGDNGTGKTTIFDAFVWMFFGKDSTDRKNFQIKTLDKFNVAIPKIEHEVSAVVVIDGREFEIRRILKENWVTKRGSETSEFQGNETTYYWDGVPMLLKDFTTRVNSVMDEVVFKLITNPLAFNSMKWEDCRNVLIQISGGEDLDALAKGNPAYENLVKELSVGKTLAEYKRQVASTITQVKQEIKMIPTRIDEVSKSKPESFDFESLRTLLDVKNGELAKIDIAISDKSSAFDVANQANNQLKTKVSNLKYEIEQIQVAAMREAKSKSSVDTSVLDGLRRNLDVKQAELATAQNGLTSLNGKVSGLAGEMTALDAKTEAKRAEWFAENAKEITFDENAFCCPTCKRDFDESDKAEQKESMKANFMLAKKSALAEITLQGQAIKSNKTNIENEVSDLNTRITNGQNVIDNLKNEIQTIKDSIDTENSKTTEAPDADQENTIYESILSMNADYKVKGVELEKLQSEIVDVPVVDTEALKSQKAELVISIDAIKDKLRNEAAIEKVNERILELESEEKQLAGKIADVEKQQFTIDNFNRLRIDTMERKVNSMFKFVSFKMFELQINGGEKECCEALIEGIPFSDANTASKINSGLDIINTLCDFYKVTAPIFIDNRESIVNLIETESQIINLIVSESDKSLRVESVSELEKAVA